MTASDEVTVGLRCAAARGPAIGRTMGEQRSGRLVFVGVDPDVAFAVAITDQITRDHADRTCRGGRHRRFERAPLEAFSARGPFSSELDAERSWMIRGLAEAFDQG